jgi:hypothetical protein
MKAELLMHERHVLDASAFVEIVIWRLPRSAAGSAHRFKYRLALVIDEKCVLRYDNEAGKGDHKHVDDAEQRYVFTTPETLVDDFWREVDRRRR